MKALFLSPQLLLSDGGGGQQQCTREYHETLAAAGFELVDVTYDVDRLWLTRLRRKLRPAPYANLIPDEFFSRLAASAEKENPAFVFCNPSDFIPMGARIRETIGDGSRIVLLSAGLASVDEVHAARIARQPGASDHFPDVSDAWIGRRVRVESEGLPHFDHVFCLAPFEVEICRWLGARSVSWVPRTIRTDRALPWNPAGNRVGFVGTFDHPPNLEGLEAFCQALHATGSDQLRVRLVTRSRRFAAELCGRYAFVDDLGALDGAPGALEQEAATWSAFVHPIFCYAMGCSTKLATGLNWQIPVLTTTAGRRGYTWAVGSPPIANSAEEMATLALEMLDPVRAGAVRDEIVKAAHSAPSVHDVADQMRRDLSLA